MRLESFRSRVFGVHSQLAESLNIYDKSLNVLVILASVFEDVVLSARTRLTRQDIL